MSLFTVIVVFWGVYQLVVSISKKNKRATIQRDSDGSRDPGIPPSKNEGRESGKVAWMQEIQKAFTASHQKQEGGDLSGTPSLDDDIEDLEKESHETKAGDRKSYEGACFSANMIANKSEEGLSVSRIGEKTMVGESEEEEQLLTDFDSPVTGRAVVQGFVWSEILGRPRALRSFRGPKT